jgi:hypothetical protein
MTFIFGIPDVRSWEVQRPRICRHIEPGEVAPLQLPHVYGSAGTEQNAASELEVRMRTMGLMCNRRLLARRLLKSQIAPSKARESERMFQCRERTTESSKIYPL